MLNTYSYSKRFRLHLHLFLIQHGKCIAGAVTDGKNTDICLYMPLRPVTVSVTSNSCKVPFSFEVSDPFSYERGLRLLMQESLFACLPQWTSKGQFRYEVYSHTGLSLGAPFFTKISSTFRPLPSLSFTRVLSLPSEKVPAPPSPNCTFDSGSRL